MAADSVADIVRERDPRSDTRRRIFQWSCHRSSICMETGTKREQQARPKGYSWPVRKDGSAEIRRGKKSAL